MKISDSKHVLITGGNGYLGSHLVNSLISKGLKITGITTTKKKEHNKNVDWIESDLTDLEGIKRTMSKLDLSIFGTLIHCAAISIDKTILNLNKGNILDSLNGNLKSIFLMNQMFHESTNESHIILISSRVGMIGNHGQTLYSLCKGTLTDYAKNQAFEFGQKNNKINVLIPGVHDSKILGEQRIQVIENAIQQSALKTTTDINDVINAVHFIMKSKTITGQIFSIESRIY